MDRTSRKVVVVRSHQMAEVNCTMAWVVVEVVRKLASAA